MANPILVEIVRGEIVESAHRGTVAVYDGDGGAVLEVGDASRPVFPRSAVKSIQALPLLETGAADAFGFGDRELALACASHGGEPEHAELAAAMLSRAGTDASALECGWHWPTRFEASLDLARAGRTPNALHNNCSGKHAGFVCTCMHAKLDVRGYVRADHPFQEMVRIAMQEVTGAPHDERNRAIDGCSIPTYAIPVRNLAIGMARMASGVGLSSGRADAARRLFAACMAQPFLVAGTEMGDTVMMGKAPGRIFVKMGAEGVYCAALPELGLGMALKCDDGAGRGAEAMIAAVLARLLHDDEPLAAELLKRGAPAIKSRVGVDVGTIRPAGSLAAGRMIARDR